MSKTILLWAVLIAFCSDSVVSFFPGEIKYSKLKEKNNTDTEDECSSENDITWEKEFFLSELSYNLLLNPDTSDVFLLNQADVFFRPREAVYPPPDLFI